MSFKYHVLENYPEVVTSEFGYRTDPVSGAPNKLHRGIDLLGKNNSICSVLAFAGGTVTKVDTQSSRGHYIIIRHNENYSTLYQHLKAGSTAVSVGQKVTQGQKIAYIGNTGYTTGPHLHFEVWKGEEPVNPRPFLEGTQTITPTGGAEEKVVVIARGDVGVQVEILQGILVRWNYYTQEIDGRFGPATEAAVKKYQSENGLVVDGRCGPATSTSIANKIKQ